MTDPVNVLKPYLYEQLPESFELNDGEMLVDALVVVRIQDVQTGGERLEYTTTRGLSIYTARGMVLDVSDRIATVMSIASHDGIEREDDDGEGV